MDQESGETDSLTQPEESVHRELPGSAGSAACVGGKRIVVGNNQLFESAVAGGLYKKDLKDTGESALRLPLGRWSVPQHPWRGGSSVHSGGRRRG